MRNALVIIICLLCALPCLAQGGTKTFDVETSPLNLKTSEAQAKTTTQDEPKRKRRNKAETDKLFDSMVESYRSACCPFQSMDDTQCPCHDHQTFMLRFLIREGFSRTEVRDYMVYGGPKELTEDYKAYLRERGKGSVIEDFMRKRGRSPSGFWEVGDVQGPGWELGWTPMILESPDRSGMWILVVIISLLVIGSFGTGYVILKRSRAGDKGDADANAAEAPVTLSDEERAAIEREAAALDD